MSAVKYNILSADTTKSTYYSNRDCAYLHVGVGDDACLVALDHALVERDVFAVHHVGRDCRAMGVSAALHGACPVVS